MKLPSSPVVPLIYLLPLRLWVGASFVIAGRFKIIQGAWGGDYAPMVEEHVVENLDKAFDFYRPFLESVVLPNTATFAILVGWGELLFGLSIFLGLFTRLGAAVGIFVVLNFTFSEGWPIWLPGGDPGYIWTMLTLLVCGAGRIWGVDQILRNKWGIKLFT